MKRVLHRPEEEPNGYRPLLRYPIYQSIYQNPETGVEGVRADRG